MGTNSKLKFWGDNWVKGDTIRGMIKGPLCAEEHDLTIAEVFQNGNWNWEATSFVFPIEVKEWVCAIPMQMFRDKEDTLLWKMSRDGDFNTASAYTLTIAEESHQIFIGNWIWKLDVWPKIISFLWLCHHDSVPVRQVIASKGINCDPICLIYRRQNETINHMLRECPFVKTVWSKLSISPALSNSNHLDFLVLEILNE